MNRFRPLLTVVLGLMLWAQGVGIAAAPLQLTSDPGSTMEMPCHGDTSADASADVAPCDCCDSDCTDMAACVIGHFAGAPATTLHLVTPAHAAMPSAAWAPKTAVLPFPLRPPITSHA